MATGSYLTPNHSRSQSEIQGDLHTMVTVLLNDYNTTRNNTTESFEFNKSCIGEISAAKCRAENGQIILMDITYVSSNQRVEKIIEFVHKNLVAYTEAGSTLLNKLPIGIDFSKDK
ncbi:uncharacterized protein TNCV_1054381 [Trichonephila clavipes]|nr:uncharacterized protein TNCV_1054381 [Trichonephila clavipes]